MKSIFKLFAFAILAFMGGALAVGLYHGIAPQDSPSLDLKYVDFISITLTALSLMITILGFFVAAAGVIGWATIETKLREHSLSYFREQLSKDGSLREELENLISNIAYEGIESFKSQQGIVDAAPPSNLRQLYT